MIANALATGASLHIVHMNSSADEMARTTLEMIRGARERGIDITTESYPYTAGSTRIESALFDSWEGLTDEEYSRLQWSGTPERLNAESFRRYREQGGWVVIHGRNEETNEWIVAQPDVIVASDGIPYLYAAIHPRGAGTYSRVLGHYVRERGALSLMDALAKMTILPAQRVEGFAPVMARKGRVQAGADADLTVFDPETIIDRSTYADPAAPSEGVMYVLVGGDGGGARPERSCPASTRVSRSPAACGRTAQRPASDLNSAVSRERMSASRHSTRIESSPATVATTPSRPDSSIATATALAQPLSVRIASSASPDPTSSANSLSATSSTRRGFGGAVSGAGRRYLGPFMPGSLTMPRR